MTVAGVIFWFAFYTQRNISNLDGEENNINATAVLVLLVSAVSRLVHRLSAFSFSANASLGITLPNLDLVLLSKCCKRKEKWGSPTNII